MSFFPILTAPGCKGRTTVFNFPPNNWEKIRKDKRLINLTWTDGVKWRSEPIGELAFGDAREFTYDDLKTYLPPDALPLLSLGAEALPATSQLLPESQRVTVVPSWRATLGLFSPTASTCYQGELDPFPAPGSLLTFAPFIQFSKEVKNFMLLLNVEKKSQIRKSLVEIYDSANPENLKGSFEVQNNNISIIPLDELTLGTDDLPVIICKGMSGIPLYFSKTIDGNCLSLEHTHPPASFVIHGKRIEAQKILKTDWFTKLGM